MFRVMRPVSTGFCLVAGAAATTSLLFAQPAAALDFVFTVSEPGSSVTGIIRGLAETGANQTPTSVEVTASTIGGLGSYSQLGGNGFTTVGGSVTLADWFGCISGDCQNNFGIDFSAGIVTLSNPGPTQQVRGTPVFTPDSPSSSVPGPLPLFGAAAAFGFSRKLRDRLKSSKPPVASAIH